MSHVILIFSLGMLAEYVRHTAVVVWRTERSMRAGLAGARMICDDLRAELASLELSLEGI